MGRVLLFMSVVAATVFVAAATDTAGGDGPLSGGHAEAAYRGWRSACAQVQNRRCSVDPKINAGQAYATGLEANGAWAATWVGADEDGPDVGEYRRSLIWAIMAVPLLAGCSGLLAGRCGACLVPWLAIGLWMLRPNVELFDRGFVELTLLGPLCGVYLAGLGRFHRTPGFLAWAAIALSSAVGWHFCPAAWLVFFVPATIVWLIISSRHSWPWHAFLMLSVLAGAAPYLQGWHELLRWRSLLNEIVPAEGQRTWIALGESTTRLSILLVIHSVIAAAPWIAGAFSRRALRAIALTITALGLVAVVRPDVLRSEIKLLPQIWVKPASPVVDCESWWAELTERVDGSARVLVESAGDDQPPADDGFSAVLRLAAPVLIGVRTEGDAGSWTFAEGRLGSRSLTDWSDDELARLFNRWNVGWVIVRSPGAIARFRRCTRAVQIPLPEREDGVLAFALDRRRSYVLTGRGKWTVDENGDIVLTDVVPDGGELVLSLRYHPGWSANPSRVGVEPEIDPYDPCPALRLRPGGPVSRIVLFPAGN